MTRARDVSNLLGTGTTTVKVSNIQNPSSSVANLSLASDGTVSGGIPSPNRNILYNGAMQVAQRGTSTAGIRSGYYTADRWDIQGGGSQLFTESVENDAPTGSGLRKSLKLLTTTASTSPAAGDFQQCLTRLEGQDLQRIAKGTASAQQLTLSFWVKSNVTGTYVVELFDNDNARSVSAAYTVSASATWEKKTITFPADTTGALDNDNAESLRVIWWLLAGSTFSSGTLATTWGSATSANRAAGQTNLAAATNNYLQVTGVQLEVGPVASAFEFKSYGQELRECQRYYFKATGDSAFSTYGTGYASSTTEGYFPVKLGTTMRVEPTSLDYSTLAAVLNGAAAYSLSTVTLDTNGSHKDWALVKGAGATGLTQWRPYELANFNSASGYIGFSAEL